MANLENTYILVAMYYNEYDQINNQEFWSFDSMEEAKEKEQELVESAQQKLETLIHVI
jgi:hypothetical protein